jgi:hypothetical protein
MLVIPGREPSSREPSPSIDLVGWPSISEAVRGQASLQYAQAIQAVSLVSGNTIKALNLLPRGYHARWEALKCKLRPALF